MSFGKYKACESCWSDAKKFVKEKEMEARKAKDEMEIAQKRLAAKERCIDWVWIVRWTTPSKRTFSCDATRAYIRLFSCREDALKLVNNLRDNFIKIDEDAHKDDVKNYGFRIGGSCGGGSDEEPEEVGKYMTWPDGYSVALECRAVNSSPCDFSRCYDIDGNPMK